MKKSLLTQFNIGFEFELLFKEDMLHNFLLEKKEHSPDEFNKIIEKLNNKIRSKDILKKNKIINYILQTGDLKNCQNADIIAAQCSEIFLIDQLNNYFPEDNWKKLISGVVDSSIEDTDKTVSAEIILQHDSGEKTLVRLEQIFYILNMIKAETNESCGLHLNVSYKEGDNAHKQVIDFLSNIDLRYINKAFGRLNNNYCNLNTETIIDDSEFNELLSNTIKKFHKVHNIKRSNSNPYEICLSDLINIWNTKCNKKLQSFMNIMKEFATPTILCEWEDDRKAIAPKNKNNKKYYEFRSMGGKNYHKKLTLVQQCTEMIVQGMYKSLLETKKLSRTKATP